jgi:hypothetical protein
VVFFIPPAYEGGTDRVFGNLSNKIQTPGNYPEENTQHGGSLKSRKAFLLPTILLSSKLKVQKSGANFVFKRPTKIKIATQLKANSCCSVIMYVFRYLCLYVMSADIVGSSYEEEQTITIINDSEKYACVDIAVSHLC